VAYAKFAADEEVRETSFANDRRVATKSVVAKKSPGGQTRSAGLVEPITAVAVDDSPRRGLRPIGVNLRPKDEQNNGFGALFAASVS